MSCGCGENVIFNQPTPPRVMDTEAVLMCDVLADGTVAKTVLLEPVYDQSTGLRVGQRIVDPATGADYQAQGTLGECPPPEACSCQTVLLCHTPAAGADPVPFLRHICRTCDGQAAVLTTELDGITEYDATGGTVGVCGTSEGARQVIERCGCDEAPDGIVRYIELWSVDTSDPDAEPLLLGSWQDGDFEQPYTPVNPVECPGEVDDAPLVLGQVCYDDGTGTIRQAAVVMCATCTTPSYRDVETGAELTAPAFVPCPADPGCDSPTTPVTSVGLCLADGTPIAVTITRDCTGATVSEGWLNLVTGAWTAGAVPAGTTACGDSRSIQVSGTFCAVDDATGDVVGLVLIEYSYDDAGAISSVRLVDAITGTTYTPPAGVTVTTCPTGTEQPEQDAVLLCHTAADGTVTRILRDYRRDETGAIVAHSDYTLNGAPYDTSTGTVGLCPPADDCEVVQLCDVQHDVPAVLPSFGTPDRRWQTLSNGVRWMKRGADSAMPSGWYNADSNTPERFDFDRPVSIRYTVRFSGPTAAPLRIPAGWYLDGLNVTQHAWDATTRTISPTSQATQAGESTFRINPQTVQTMTAPALTTAQTSGQSSQYGQITVTADLVTPFLRTVCRDESGTATVTDTALDAVTAYATVGTVSVCEPQPAGVQAPCADCETLTLCDVSALPPATISGTAASGTLPNGVTWTATNAAPAAGNRPWTPQRTNTSGAWWGLPAFPHGQTDPTKWTFSRPSTVEFSVYVHYSATNPAINWAQLPPNLQVVSLPYGYSYDAVTGVLTRTADGDPADPCSYMTDPQIATAARFRTAGPVTDLTTQAAPNSRVAVCGTFLTYWAGALTVAPGGPFLRRICRDCDGAVTSVTDTRLDGTTPYAPAGTVGVCEPTHTCSDCETQQLCDRLTSNAGHEATIVPANGQSTGTTETGVTWSIADPDGNPVSFNRPGSADGYWVGIQTYPTASAGPFTWTFTDPVTVEFGIVLVPTGSGTTTMPLPPGVRPVSLPAGYTYDAATNSLVSAVPNATGGPGCQALANPSRAVAARFATKGPVTSLTITTPQAQPVCGQVGVSRVGGFVLNPEANPFLRTVCRDCDGKTLSVTDTTLDGTTRYTPVGEVVDCAQAQQDEQAGPDCEYVVLCAPLPAERLTGGDFPDAASFNANWTHRGAAQWVGGNGPDGRAGFVDFSPANGYDAPAIEQTATVEPGVDYQFICQFGVWGAGGTEQPRGRIQIFDGAGTVLYTQDVAPTIGGGITWPANGRVGPVTVTATDDTMRVLLSDVSDPGGGDAQFQIDLTVDNVSLLGPSDLRKPFLRRYCRSAGEVTVTDTELDGVTPYRPLGAVGVCGDVASSDTAPAEQVVSTGARNVTGTAPVDLAAEHPGLQSVTLVVSAGSVLATLTDGAAVPIPAGTTATWSVARDQDSALDAASFAGADAGSTYLLLWTYTA